MHLGRPSAEFNVRQSGKMTFFPMERSSWRDRRYSSLGWLWRIMIVLSFDPSALPTFRTVVTLLRTSFAILLRGTFLTASSLAFFCLAR